MDFYASVDDVLHDAIRQLDRGSLEGTPSGTPAPPETEKDSRRDSP
jgi:hypothetical protein